MTAKDVEVILKDIAAASRRRSTCSVAVALRALDPAAKKAFDIALAADIDEYPHMGISRKLQEMSGVRIGKDAVAKHRKTIANKPGGCGCGR